MILFVNILYGSNALMAGKCQGTVLKLLACLFCFSVVSVNSVTAKGIEPQLSLTKDEIVWLKAHPSIRLGFNPDMEPLLIKDTDGRKIGVLPDIFAQLEAVTGLKVNIEVGPWHEIIKQAGQGKIDGLLLCVPELAATKGLLPTRQYISTMPVVFGKDDAHFTVNRISDLKGKRVAYMREVKFIENILAPLECEITAIEADSFLTALTMVLEGKADVALGLNYNTYLLTQSVLTGIKPLFIDTSNAAKTVTAVRPDWPELVTILNKGLAVLGEAQINQILGSWTQLKTSKAEPVLQLSDEERAWLKTNPQLTLAVPINYPRSYYGIDGKLQGMGMDYVHLLEQKLGIQFKPIVSDWHTALNRAMNHEVDTILNADKIKDRESQLNFTEVYFASPQIVIAPEKEEPISDLSELCGRRIAVHQGSSRAEFLQQNYPCIDLVEVKNKKEILPAIIANKADAGFDNFDSVMGNLQEMKIPGLKIIYFKYLPPTGFARIGVRKDKPLLASILNKAVLSISNKEKTHIVTKWLGVVPPLPVELERKGANLELTQSEQAFLKKHPLIRVGADSAWEPIEFLGKDGNYKGLAIDYLKQIEAMLGVRFEFVRETNWQELIARARKQELDIFSCVAQTAAREEYLLFTEPYIEMPAGIFAREDVGYITDLHMIAGEKIAVVEGYAIHDYLVANYPDIELLLAKTPAEGLRYLQDEKAFAFIDNTITTGYLISHQGYQHIKMAGEIPFVFAQRIGVRKDWSQLRNILQKALAAIPDADQHAIYNKWVPVVYERPRDYSLFWEIGAGFLALVCLIFFWNRKLAAEVSKRTADYRQSEKRFRGAFNHAGIGMGLVSLEGRWLRVNQTLCYLVGYTEEELLALTVQDITYPADLEKDLGHVRDLIEGRDTTYEMEKRYIHKEGQLIWIQLNVSLLRDEKEQPLYFISQIQDISERKQVLEKLQASEKNYREIFKSASDAIFILSKKDRKIVDCNLKAQEMFKGDAAEIIGKTPGELSPPRQPDGSDSQAEAQEIVSTVLSSRDDMTFEWQHMRLNGEIFDAEVSLTLIEIEAEQFIQAIMRDITERKRLDREIRLLQHWIEHSVDLFFWVREDSRILYGNQAVCSLLEYSPEEVRTMKVSDFDLDLPLAAWPDFTRKLREQGAFCFETHLCKKSGAVVPVEITANILGFEGKDHFFAFARDISAKVSAEEDRQELAKQLNQAQKMEAIGTLAGGIAHDFNNILSAIFGFSELALMDINNEEQLRQDIDEVTKAADRAKNLVTQILTFSRKTDQEIQPLQVSLVVKEALKLLRSTIPTTIQIKANVISQGVALVDPTQIHQIVMNLCTNAYHAMRETGGILAVGLTEVELSEDDIISDLEIKPGKYLQLEVSDTGTGIDEKTKQNIFDPYFTTKEKGEGTGLGLAVVHGIVKSYSGYINVYSEPGQGTSFHVYLPLVERDAVADKKTVEKEPIPGGTERIMFVDDEESLVGMAAEILPKYGYKVQTYRNAVGAFQDFEKQADQYDLVITDLTMPGMTGAELAQKILAIRPDMPIILCTGHSEIINREKALAMGIKEYLAKPIRMSLLVRTIGKLLDPENKNG